MNIFYLILIDCKNYLQKPPHALRQHLLVLLRVYICCTKIISTEVFSSGILRPVSLEVRSLITEDAETEDNDGGQIHECF